MLLHDGPYRSLVVAGRGTLMTSCGWLIEPVLPPWPQYAPGPRTIPDRLCLQGILFVPHTGIGWDEGISLDPVKTPIQMLGGALGGALP